MSDPIVDGVRRIRKEHTEKFSGDLTEICRDLREFQEKSGHKAVKLEPKRLPRSQTDAGRKEAL